MIRPGVKTNLPDSAEALKALYQARHHDAANRSLNDYREDEFMPQWMSRSYQKKAFEILVELGANRFPSLLDIGCGYGCLLPHLRSLGWTGRYTGIDLVPEFIETCRSTFAEDESAHFVVGDYLTDDIIHQLDRHALHVASSLFGIAYLPDMLSQVILRATSLAGRAVIITCNSTLHRQIDSDARTYAPDEVLNLIIQYTPDITLLQRSVRHQAQRYALLGAKIDLDAIGLTAADS